MILTINKSKMEKSNKYDVQNKASILIMIILLVKSLVSKELFMLMSFIYFLYLLNKTDLILYNKLPSGVSFLIINLLLGTAIGLWNIIGNKITIYSLIRDIFYFITPIIYIYIGSYFYIIYKERVNVYRSIIIIGVYKAAIFVWNALIMGGISQTIDVNVFRMESGGYVICTSLALIIMAIDTERKLIKNNIIKTISILICLVALIISFSRNEFVFILCSFMIILLRQTKIKQSTVIKSFVIFTFILIVLSVTYRFIPSELIDGFMNKLLRSFEEISTQGDWSRYSTIQKNWRGYEVYCAQQLIESHSIANLVLGQGLGKMIYLLGITMDLNGELFSELPIIHNGYYMILVKVGIVGLLMYCMMILKNIKLVMVSSKFNILKLDSTILLTVIIAVILKTLTVVGLYSVGSQFELCFLIGYITVKIKDYYLRENIKQEMYYETKKNIS